MVYLHGKVLTLKCCILFFILSSLSELTTAWKSLAQSKAAVSVLLSDSIKLPDEIQSAISHNDDDDDSFSDSLNIHKVSDVMCIFSI